MNWFSFPKCLPILAYLCPSVVKMLVSIAWFQLSSGGDFYIVSFEALG
jgi:hypothetical protein